MVISLLLIIFLKVLFLASPLMMSVYNTSMLCWTPETRGSGAGL